MTLLKSTPTVCNDEHVDINHEERIKHLIPDENAAADIADVFRQLADSTRVRLLSMLAIESICVCEMADILGMSQPAVSHHLRTLRASGIVRYKKDGKRAMYSLSDSEVGKMVRHVLADMSGTGGGIDGEG